jgi:hypothetical protein
MPGGAPPITWRSETSLTVDGVDYDLQHATATEPGRLRLYKSRAMVEGYAPIVDEFAGSNIFELGIFGGGSTAFFAQVCRPRRLVAVELSPDRVTTLDALLERLDLTERVSLHYGVDQSDQPRLAAIADTCFGDDPLDLVIDDASHLYGPTRASFEVLFPRLRPGGLYVIEDWRSQDWFIRLFTGVIGLPPGATRDDIEVGLAASLVDADGIEGRIFEHWFATEVTDPASPYHGALSAWFEGLPSVGSPAAAAIHARLTAVLAARRSGPGAEPPPTMGTLAAELCMGMKSGHPALAEVTVGPHWITARRGPDPLPEPFTLDAVADDPFAILSPHGSGLPSAVR